MKSKKDVIVVNAGKIIVEMELKFSKYGKFRNWISLRLMAIAAMLSPFDIRIIDANGQS